MLLVEQGVLWVLPMLWLVLLLSEAGTVLETGCSLEMGPGSRRGETRLRAAGADVAQPHGTTLCTNPPQAAPKPPRRRWAWGAMVAPGRGVAGAPLGGGGELGSRGCPERGCSPVVVP